MAAMPPFPADTKDAVRYSSLYLSSLQRHSVLSGWRQLDLRMAQLVQSHRSGAAPLVTVAPLMVCTLADWAWRTSSRSRGAA